MFITPKWKMMCNSVGHWNDSEFESWGEWVFFSTQPLLRMEALHGGQAIHPKLPIEVHLKWRMNIISIGHQSKSRNKRWILNHLIWLASIGNRGFACKFISLDSIGTSLWSLDQTEESYGLTTQWSMSRHIRRWKHLGVCLDTGTFQGWIS